MGMMDMEAWLLFLLIAVAFGAIGLYRARAARRGISAHKNPKTIVPRVVDDISSKRFQPTLPEVWDERTVSQQLTEFRSRPDIVASYIDALKQRFILKVEDGTAQQRTRFLRTHVEELQLGKEYRALIHDLGAMEIEQENRLLRLKLEQQELQAKQAHANALGGLQLQKSRLAIEVEIASLEAQKTAIQTPDRQENLTPQQRRTAEKKECEAQITDLKAQKAEALKIADEEERMRRVNGLDAALERAYERWSKLL